MTRIGSLVVEAGDGVAVSGKQTGVSGGLAGSSTLGEPSTRRSCRPSSSAIAPPWRWTAACASTSLPTLSVMRKNTVRPSAIPTATDAATRTSITLDPRWHSMSVLHARRRDGDRSRLPNERSYGHRDDSGHVSASIQVRAHGNGRAAQETGEARHWPFGLGDSAGEADGSQLLQSLLSQEQRDSLATLSGDVRTSHAEQQRETEYRDRQDDAGHEDFEQRDPVFVAETQPGTEESRSRGRKIVHQCQRLQKNRTANHRENPRRGGGLTVPEETPLARHARRKGRCGQEPPSP